MKLEAGLTRLLGGSTCIVGMGNYYRSDDAAGLHVLDRLAGFLKGAGPEIINVEDVLESYVFLIADKPCENVLIIDAVNAGAEEGTVIFGDMEEMKEVTKGISSHKIALESSCRIFRESGKRVYLLGISVRHTDFGAGLSPVIADVVELLSDLIISIIGSSGIHIGEGIVSASAHGRGGDETLQDGTCTERPGCV